MLASNQQFAPALPPAMTTPASHASRRIASRPCDAPDGEHVRRVAARPRGPRPGQHERAQVLDRPREQIEIARLERVRRERAVEASPRRDRCRRSPSARSSTLGLGRIGQLEQERIDRVVEGHCPPPIATMCRSVMVSCIGMRTPRSCATSIARSYPASACRTTPMPGSDRQHALRAARAAFAVPSATTTMPGVDRVPDPHAAAVVHAHPVRAGGGVDQRVEDRPVGDRVGAVQHGLGLAVWDWRRCRRPGDRARSRSAPTPRPSATISLKRSPGAIALAVAEPADPRRAAPGTRHAPRPSGANAAGASSSGKSSATARSVLAMSAGSPRERRPAERSLALAEQRPHERRHEPRDTQYARSCVEPAELRARAQVVAVVEDDRAGLRRSPPSPRRGRPSTRTSAATYSSGSRRGAHRPRAATARAGTYPPSGSCALVWSVTTSAAPTRAASSSGKTSAQLPTSPIETASPRGLRRRRPTRAPRRGRRSRGRGSAS